MMALNEIKLKAIIMLKLKWKLRWHYNFQWAKKLMDGNDTGKKKDGITWNKIRDMINDYDE